MALDPLRISDLKSNSGGGGFIETFVRKQCVGGRIMLKLLGFGEKIGNGDFRSSISNGWLVTVVGEDI